MAGVAAAARPRPPVRATRARAATARRTRTRGQDGTTPGPTVTPATPSGPPASQTVLAERQTGPATTPKQIVLGARRSGGAKAPKPAKPPVAATQAHGAPSASHGALPFTGGNEVAALA